MPWPHIAFLGLGGALLAFIAFSQLRKARRIEDTPTSTIRSAAQGYVELTGITLKDAQVPVFSPLTGEPCLWYEYHVQRYERRGKDSEWRTIERGRSADAILLDDKTGQVFVHPDKADINTVHQKTWQGSSARPSGPAAMPGTSGGFAGGAGGGLSFSIGSAGRYKYHQRLIKAGDVIYVLGHFQTLQLPSAEQQSEERKRQLINSWKQDFDSMIARFDSNEDGQIDLKEWEQVRQAAAAEAAAETLDNFDHEVASIVTHSPVRGQPYIIANRDPKTLAGRYRWTAFACGAGAAICAGLILSMTGNL